MILLNSVISKMDELVFYIVIIEFLWWSPDVRVLVEVTFQLAVDACHEPETPEIKLSTVNKEWMINVFLNNVRFRLTWLPFALLWYKFFNLIEWRAQVDTVSSVGVLTRFNDPNVLRNMAACMDSLDDGIGIDLIEIFLLFFRVLIISVSCSRNRAIHMLQFLRSLLLLQFPLNQNFFFPLSQKFVFSFFGFFDLSLEGFLVVEELLKVFFCVFRVY